MLRWVAVSEDRWELREGQKKLGALIRLPTSGWAKGWAKQNGFCDVWAPLPRGPYKTYLTAQKSVRRAALELELHLGVNSSGVLNRCELVA